MRIKEQWDQLDGATQQWLVSNPGCVLLPRSVVAAIGRATQMDGQTGPHGEAALSDEDRTFIRSKAHAGTMVSPRRPNR